MLTWMDKEKMESISKHATHMMNLLAELNQEEKDMKALKNFPSFGKKFDLTSLEGTKKYLKAMYRKEFPRYKRRVPKCKINEWETGSECGEHKTYIGIFAKTPKTMEVVSQYIDLEADNNYYDYSPTGLWFGDEARIIDLEDRIIVRKTWSLDC